MKFKQFLKENDVSSVQVKKGTPTSYSHPEAKYSNKGHIEVFPKFFKYGKGEQLHIIYHELGHWFRDKFVTLNDIMGWEENENFNIYSMGNSEEGFAEAFANYFDDPKDLKKKYPEQYARLKKYIGSKTNAISKRAKEMVDEI
jgi:hypothetical protein